MAKILVTLGGQILKEVVIQKDSTTIGRDPLSHVQLNNPAVSRQHAEIYRQGWNYYLEDKKSTNGTSVSGNAVTWKVALNDNDKITIGKFVLIFRLEPRDYPEKAKTVDSFETLCVVPDKK